MANVTDSFLAVPASAFSDYIAMVEWLGPIDWRDFVAGYRAMEAFYADPANTCIERRYHSALRKAS